MDPTRRVHPAPESTQERSIDMADARSDANLSTTLLGLLRDRVTPQQYQRWFRALQVESAPDGVVVVGAPNGFVAEWLEGYYRDVIEQCVAEVAGPDLRVEIVKSETPPSTGTRVRRRTPEDPAGNRRTGDGSPRGGAIIDGQRTIGARSDAEARRLNRKRRSGHGNSGALSVPRSPATVRNMTFAPSGSDLFGHPRYRNFLSDVILNEDYLFENFVEGPSNQLAHAAATAVSNKPGYAYNPLFLHGSVGLGKTHLLQAICTKYLQKNPEARVIYLSCESFVNQFIAAVGEGQIKDFRYRYRHVDMLLIDDIHFLAKKERTQEEFFHTFNTLYNSKKQIVLSCDSPPVEIPTLEDRLVSRFKWGLVAEIESPDHETRVSIVRKKAERRGIDLPDDAALYIADHITANVRELEGAVLRVCSYASLTGNPITMELTQESLRDLVRTKERKVSIETILRVVSDQFAVKVSELTGKRRHKSISHPRQIAMYLARRLTQYSLVEIGGQFGGRDHTTVIYANEKVARELETNPRLREDLEMLVRRIRTGA
jgi:chromosomal replication initiator protein